MLQVIMYGKEKNGDIKQWSIGAEWVHCDMPEVQITISHGKLNGKLTTKVESITEGKQGRTVGEQAILECKARIKKQKDKGYRDSIEELDELPLLAMLAGDYNKIGHRIDFTKKVYGSVKLDGVRCVAKRKDGVVTLESRTGQAWDVPAIVCWLEKVMYDGEILDGELYVHGQALQDITSAAKRTDPDKEIAKCQRAYAKAELGSEGYAKASEELEHALLIKQIREDMTFVVFDALEVGLEDAKFSDRLVMLEGLRIAINDYDDASKWIKVLDYDVVESDEQLRSVWHPRAVKLGYEGYMLRSADGVYESGKRSADLQKFKTFLDEEFEIQRTTKDKQGYVVFELKNNINEEEFSCVIGDYGWRLKVADDDFSGQWMTIQFQSRYKDTLLPQFPSGKLIREGKVVDGVFVPAV